MARWLEMPEMLILHKLQILYRRDKSSSYYKYSTSISNSLRLKPVYACTYFYFCLPCLLSTLAMPGGNRPLTVLLLHSVNATMVCKYIFFILPNHQYQDRGIWVTKYDTKNDKYTVMSIVWIVRSLWCFATLLFKFHKGMRSSFLTMLAFIKRRKVL